MFGAKFLYQGIQWRIQDGDSVHFWKDKWMHNGPLIENNALNVSIVDTQLKVKDFLINDNWNLRMLHDAVDQDNVAIFIKTPASMHSVEMTK